MVIFGSTPISGLSYLAKYLRRKKERKKNWSLLDLLASPQLIKTIGEEGILEFLFGVPS